MARGTPCAVCRHHDRSRIELMRASGASLDVIAKKFSLGRDSVWRRYAKHVSNETKAYLIAGPAKLDELVSRANAEQVSLLDYLQIIRSALMTMFQAAIQKGDHNAAATASGRLLQVLGTIGRLSGELATYAGGGGTSIVNNTLVINSPAFAKLQATVISALAPYPEARLAVIGALRSVEGTENEIPVLPPPAAAYDGLTSIIRERDMIDA